MCRKPKRVNRCINHFGEEEQQRPLLACFDATHTSDDTPSLPRFYYCRLSEIQVGQRRHQTAASCDQGDGGLCVSVQQVHEATMQCLKNQSDNAIGILKSFHAF